MTAQPQIEPVTDEDHDAFRRAYNDTRDTGGTLYVAFIAAMEQDRRRVAERQAAEIERLRAEVAKLREQMDADLATYTETMEEATATMARVVAELVASSAEVAKLRAACAAKDAALNRCADWFGRPSPHFDDKDSLAYAVHAALSDTAGAGWIDATGAVEATAVVFAPEHGVEVCAAVPDDWAGDTVKIVRVKP